MNTPANIAPAHFHKLINLMAVSTMSDDEKTAWLHMLPAMHEEEIGALMRMLSEEVEKLTDLYLMLLSKRI